MNGFLKALKYEVWIYIFTSNRHLLNRQFFSLTSELLIPIWKNIFCIVKRKIWIKKNNSFKTALFIQMFIFDPIFYQFNSVNWTGLFFQDQNLLTYFHQNINSNDVELGDTLQCVVWWTVHIWMTKNSFICQLLPLGATQPDDVFKTFLSLK